MAELTDIRETVRERYAAAAKAAAAASTTKPSPERNRVLRLG